MDGISPCFFTELFRLIRLLTLEESARSGITQMGLNPAKPALKNFRKTICHLELPCPLLSPTRQFLAGISFGAATVDAALVTITMPEVIRICLNFDFRQLALFPIAMLAAPCSSTNSLTKPTIP